MAGGARLILVLSENWTIIPPDDPIALVGLAQEAEAAGVDAVMLSEHVVLGGDAAADGLMSNPREYALPGNQDPATSWPSSVVLLGAIAAATTRLRLVAGAILAPLRHPLLLARELGTLDLLSRGRLVVLPSVGWHEPEYEALGVDFRRRGRLLDEQLAVWERALARVAARASRASTTQFNEVWLEPEGIHGRAGRGCGSAVARCTPRLSRAGRLRQRLQPPRDDLRRSAGHVWPTGCGRLAATWRRSRWWAGCEGAFPDDESTADLAEAVEDAMPRQLARGFSSFCFKPNQFIDDVADWGELCREAVARVGEAVDRHGGIETAHAVWAATGAGAR